MAEDFDRLLKMVYEKWDARRPQAQEAHPDEEEFALFLENKLTQEERERIQRHILDCRRCAEIAAVQLRLETAQPQEVPAELLTRVEGLIAQGDHSLILEIILKLKEKALELLATTGDVLVGQELVPAPVLRSRSIKDFPDEVNILKDFQNIRVEAKVVNESGKSFTLSVLVKDKLTQKALRDLRITLMRDELELESYHSDKGRAVFEHVALGKYTVEITGIKEKVAAILLDIKV